MKRRVQLESKFVLSVDLHPSNEINFDWRALAAAFASAYLEVHVSIPDRLAALRLCQSMDNGRCLNVAIKHEIS
jgi:hypothetical protein